METNLQNVIIEANSDLVIKAVKKIQNGTSRDKVSRHWKLLQVFYRIQSHFCILQTIRFVHVRRKVDILADRLTNEGVTNGDKDSQLPWDLLPEGNLQRTA